MWKDIANYEGLYKVNSIGEVYSIRTNKFIKPAIRNNYLAVGLWNKKISSYLSKPVAQYDLNGNLIKKYNSIKEAAESLGKCDYSIRACLYGKYKTGYNYVWRLC